MICKVYSKILEEELSCEIGNEFIKVYFYADIIDRNIKVKNLLNKIRDFSEGDFDNILDGYIVDSDHLNIHINLDDFCYGTQGKENMRILKFKYKYYIKSSQKFSVDDIKEVKIASKFLNKFLDIPNNTKCKTAHLKTTKKYKIIESAYIKDISFAIKENYKYDGHTQMKTYTAMCMSVTDNLDKSIYEIVFLYKNLMKFLFNQSNMSVDSFIVATDKDITELFLHEDFELNDEQYISKKYLKYCDVENHMDSILNNLNGFYFNHLRHYRNKSSRFIDHADIILTTSAFEYEFLKIEFNPTRKPKEIRAIESLDKCIDSIKSRLDKSEIDLIEEFYQKLNDDVFGIIKESHKEAKSDGKRLLDSLREDLVKITLQKKIFYIYSIYKKLLHKKTFDSSASKTKEFGKYIAKARNRCAHGDITIDLSYDEILERNVLEKIIKIMQLKEVGYGNDSINLIIKKIY